MKNITRKNFKLVLFCFSSIFLLVFISINSYSGLYFINQNSVVLENDNLNDDCNIIRSAEAHAKIVINGDGDFTAPNGVRNPGAAGTANDPYVISGWVIDAGGPGNVCINISNTNAKIICRSFKNDSKFGSGIN